MFTVEDYIEILAGVQAGGNSIKLERPDYNLITSLARQTFRGVAYTDRQFELAKNKVLHYQDQLNAGGFNVLDEHLKTPRMPLREIDRSRWIKIVDNIDEITEFTSSKAPFIAVRFTFQKKLISALETLQVKNIHYDKRTKVQYFEYSEQNLFRIVSAFTNKNFEIDPQVQELYNKITKFSREETLPGVYNNQIKNLPTAAIEELKNTLGTPTDENLILYKDRSLKYGLYIDDYVTNVNSLHYRIAQRKSVNVSVDSKIVNIGELLIALEELKRTKILILLSNNSHQTYYDKIVDTHQHIRNLIDPKDVSVTFRLDNNSEGYAFNEYIKRQQINNKVDTNTKIVYNVDNKMPKPLFLSNWIPDIIIVLGSSGFVATRKVLECYPGVDLIIHYVEGNSTHGYRSYLGKGIDKL
jgi:hypothetical protein